MLILQAVNVTNGNNWRWLLSDATGQPMADQVVALKPSSFEYEGFADLLGYLERQASPDRRARSEARLLDRLGEWLGSNLLGSIGSVIAAHEAPTVQVELPGELGFLLSRPFGLAFVDGVPLAQRTRLVFDLAEPSTPAKPRPKESVGETLRMLAVFSMPTLAGGRSLRRERYELSHLVGRLRRDLGTPIDLRVLQYGITRDRLASVLEEGAGWDIVHLSGHGTADSGVILETSDGRPDAVGADDLLRDADPVPVAAEAHRHVE